MLTAKGLETGKVGKTGKIGAICYQIATNSSNQPGQWANGLNVQGQPKHLSLTPRDSRFVFEQARE